MTAGPAGTHFGRTPSDLTAAVIVVSTSVAAGQSADRTSSVLREALQAWGFDTVRTHVVPDNPTPTGPSLRGALIDEVGAGTDVVLTTGGTGLTVDDRTPEVTEAMGGRLIPGIAEALRSAGVAHGVPTSMLSRGIASAIDRTLVVNLPGSPGAVADAVVVLEGVLPHAVEQLRRRTGRTLST